MKNQRSMRLLIKDNPTDAEMAMGNHAHGKVLAGIDEANLLWLDVTDLSRRKPRPKLQNKPKSLGDTRSLKVHSDGRRD